MASAIRQSASGASTSSWSHRAIYSPVAILIARFVLPDMPAFSAPNAMWNRLSRAAIASSAFRVSADVLPPSYRQASHAPCVWASSESASARRNFGRVLNTGTTTLMRTFGKGCARCTASSRLDAFFRRNRHSSRSSTRAASISPARRSVYPAPCIRTYARTRSAHCTRVPPADFPALIIPCAAGFVKHRAIFCQFGTIFAKPLDKWVKRC